MIITIAETARDQLTAFSPTKEFTLDITDGCCGKTFVFENIPGTETHTLVDADGYQFYVTALANQVAPEITIDYPGPHEGFMITNHKAIGGCGCGRSFFIEE